MSKAILDALRQLDPNNEDHWTNAGAPAVAVVSDLAGEDLKRADITAAAPEFDLEAARAGIDPDLEGGGDDNADDDADETPVDEAGHETEEQIREQIEAQKKVLDEVGAEMEALQDQHKAAMLEYQRLLAKLPNIDSPEIQQKARTDFIRRQNEKMAKLRAEGKDARNPVDKPVVHAPPPPPAMR